MLESIASVAVSVSIFLITWPVCSAMVCHERLKLFGSPSLVSLLPSAGGCGVGSWLGVSSPPQVIFVTAAGDIQKINRTGTRFLRASHFLSSGSSDTPVLFFIEEFRGVANGNAAEFVAVRWVSRRHLDRRHNIAPEKLHVIVLAIADVAGDIKVLPQMSGVVSKRSTRSRRRITGRITGSSLTSIPRNVCALASVSFLMAARAFSSSSWSKGE